MADPGRWTRADQEKFWTLLLIQAWSSMDKREKKRLIRLNPLVYSAMKGLAGE